MKLTKVQNRFINDKSIGSTILKGKNSSGKTTASIYRALNLENNYCLYQSDKILFITSNRDKVKLLSDLYNNLKVQNHFYSLFSLNEDRVLIEDIQSLRDRDFNTYVGEINISPLEIDKSEALNILNTAIFNEAFYNYSLKSKAISKMSLDEVYDEILWIKASNLTFDEYLEVQRKGRRRIFRKNSKTREYLYKLKEIYNKELSTNSYVDAYDKVTMLLNYKNIPKYSHIIVDDTENFTKCELDYIKYISKTHIGSSITFVINSDTDNLRDNAWIVKGRNPKTLFEETVKIRSFNFKNVFVQNILPKDDYMDKFKYINLKNKSVIQFNIDSSNPEAELYTDDKDIYSNSELSVVPIYNEIAAGSPMEINEGLMGNFNLPKSWLERGKESFILQVKGNSMIEKDICDGDLVVVKKQVTAYNNDIVAATVDGEATLKTLKLDKENPMLMPANKNYSPIYIENKEVSILGVVIGIIKDNI